MTTNYAVKTKYSVSPYESYDERVNALKRARGALSQHKKTLKTDLARLRKERDR